MTPQLTEMIEKIQNGLADEDLNDIEFLAADIIQAVAKRKKALKEQLNQIDEINLSKEDIENAYQRIINGDAVCLRKKDIPALEKYAFDQNGVNDKLLNNMVTEEMGDNVLKCYLY